MSDLGRSTNRTQQFGGVSHSGRAVVEGCCELWRLTEVMLWVLRRLVDNTCEHMEKGNNLVADYIWVLSVKLQHQSVFKVITNTKFSFDNNLSVQFSIQT